MRRTASLVLVSVLALASAVQAAPLPGSGTRSWWDLTLGFFGLKAEPSLPIPPDNKGRLHLPGGWTEETENDQSETAKHRLSIPGG